MVSHIILNQTTIPVYQYKELLQRGIFNIDIDFKVTSENYHDISTLLYEGTFDVKVPEKGISFKGVIQNYFTSTTNLYQEGQEADYHVSLREVKEDE